MNRPTSARRAAVRIFDPSDDESPQRRRFLQNMIAGGLAVPAALPWLESRAMPARDSSAYASAPRPRAEVIHQFETPHLELMRLLREACEVEHALMLQYLYAAFSVKPAYAALAGTGAPGANDLIGVAVQEMQHLGQVNRLLATLGGAPHLVPIEFPYEPDIYPFEFNLEPLTPKSLAKYVYTEAPVGLFDPNDGSGDPALASAVLRSIGPRRRPNYVGSLYAAIIDLAHEVERTPGSPDMKPWIARLEAIKQEGEDDHFRFFRSVFLGTHPAFGGRTDIWRLAPADPAFPSYELPSNPTAYLGHEKQIDSPSVRALAWLGNLHYWSGLLLLDQYYRFGDQLARGMALAQMLGPMMSLGRHLPTLGVGLPFDPAPFGASPGVDSAHGRRLAIALLKEAESLSRRIAETLPGDYRPESVAQTVAALQQAAPPATVR